jgi:hypothetical protein
MRMSRSNSQMINRKYTTRALSDLVGNLCDSRRKTLFFKRQYSWETGAEAHGQVEVYSVTSVAK